MIRVCSLEGMSLCTEQVEGWRRDGQKCGVGARRCSENSLGGSVEAKPGKGEEQREEDERWG